jgi:hypothetical protein
MKPLILLIWEHGYGRGHISRLLRCAEIIVERGGTPVFSVPPIYMHDPELTRYGRVIANPVVSAALIAPLRLKYVNSFADILHNVGFTSVDAMTPAMQHWFAIFDAIKPQAIVLDYAPMAGLAAQLMDIRAIRLTSGFEAPPIDCPIFPVNVVTPEVLLNNQKMVIKISETIDTLSMSLIGKHGPTLQQVLGAHTTFITAIPQTDAHDRTDGTYIGHISSHKQSDTAVWPITDKTKNKAFMYVRDLSQMKPWLDILLMRNISTLCHSPVGDKKILDEFKNTCIHISRTPFNLDAILIETDFCINYGSATMVCQSLLAGKPQLMVPVDTEKQMIAKRVSSAGLGVVDDTTPNRFDVQIDKLLNDTTLKSSVQAIAAKYPKDFVDKQVLVLADVIMSG